jgi:phosphopantetheinyl transferase (holo-ACP synthase)
MIGNDVVDLGHRSTRPGAQHPRFDARVFSERERALIAADETQRVRWLLWAAKEAAYKAVKKLDRAVVWAPSRFEVSLASRERGSVRHAARELALRMEEREDWVHVLAWGGPSAGEARSGVAEASGADLSAEARAFACRALAAQLGIEPQRLGVAKQGRVPVLCADGEPARADLSLSHHGRFVAFACELDLGALDSRRAS